MSFNYFYDSELKIIKAEIIGEFDLKKYAEIMKEIVSGNVFLPTTATIWDLREFGFDQADAGVAKSFSDARAYFPERKETIIAYVVSQPVGYGMMRMYTFLTDTVETSEVFYDYQEAINWTIKTDRNRDEIHT